MELLQNIRIITIPKSLRVVITLMLLTLFAFNIYVGMEGLLNDEKAGWAEAASSLLGVILPIIIIALLLAFSRAGIQALRDKTEEILLKVIPEQLAMVKDLSVEFYTVHDAQGDNKCSPARWPQNRKAIILSNLKKNSCYCDYEIQVPEGQKQTRLIYIRIELNVRKVNFNLYLNTEQIRTTFKISEDSSNAELSRLVMGKFGHTAEGAGGIGADTSNDYITYRINKTLYPRNLNGQSYLCLVATANLKPDLLWDPSERLYFAQDILFMLRSYYEEYPGFFALAESQTHQP